MKFFITGEFQLLYVCVREREREKERAKFRDEILVMLIFFGNIFMHLENRATFDKDQGGSYWKSTMLLKIYLYQF